MPNTVTQLVQPAKTQPKSYDEEVKILLSLADGFVLEHRGLTYASSEFTSGRRFFELCRQYNVRTAEKLKEALGSDGYAAKLLAPNVAEGIEFARAIRKLNHHLVLTPNTLKVPGWDQREYLTFWETVIRTRCKAIFFNDGWEFSDGCTFEYLVGHEEKLPLLDRAGDAIPVGRAKQLIVTAIEGLEADGFAVPKLRSVVEKL